jgi:integrase
MPRAKRKAERFPLTLHRTRKLWCKNFTLPSGRRKAVYFGHDRDSALAQYLAERDDWQAGRNPREGAYNAGTTEPTVADVVNAYLTSQKQRVQSGELRGRTMHELVSVCKRLTKALGRDRMVSTLTAADFERFKAQLSKTNAPQSVAQLVNKSKAPFKYGYEAGILETPVRFGPHFKTPGKRALRQQQNARPSRMFAPKELRKIIKAADVPLRAWILLGLNCGYGAADIATLPVDAIDLDGGWITHERAKTAERRRCALWPETVKALRESLKMRRQPRDPADAGLAFLNEKGNRLVNESQAGSRVDVVGKHFRAHLRSLGLHRPGVGHYSLRSIFRTVADPVGDDRAIRLVMGHVASGEDMASHYVQGIDDDRLRKIADHVHGWLYGDAKDKPALRIVAG